MLEQVEFLIFSIDLKHFLNWKAVIQIYYVDGADAAVAIVVIEVEAHFHVVLVRMVYAADLGDGVEESQNTNLLHRCFVDWLDEKVMKSDRNFFNIDAKAGLEASNCRLGVHIEGKWVILGVLWYVAEQVEAFEDIEEVL